MYLLKFSLNSIFPKNEGSFLPRFTDEISKCKFHLFTNKYICFLVMSLIY